MINSKNINNQILNLAFCFPISNRSERCIPEMGDDTLSYEENGYYVFERNGQYYVIPERDSHGNWVQPMEYNMLVLLQFIFGDDLIPYKDLPQEVIE